jgi:hypothetical protein
MFQTHDCLSALPLDKPTTMKRRLSCLPSGTVLGLCALGLTAFAAGERARAQAPSDVEISVEADAPASPPDPASQELGALKAQLAALEQRLSESQARADAHAAQLEAIQANAEAEQTRREETEAKQKREDLLARIAKLGVTVSGYLQVQYGQNQLSQDEVLQGGAPLNQDRFAVRRGRLRINGRWKYFRTDFELDASNTRGASVSARRASISGVLPSSEEGAPPLLMLSAGLTEVPLGHELQQGQDDILFLERTTGSLAFFPGPIDTGVKLEGAYGPFRLQVAAMNGAPIDERAGGLTGIDPTRAPDMLGRIGVDESAHPTLRIVAGVSFLTGKGFHEGSDATKPVLQWDDSDGDGQLSLPEIRQVSGRPAVPSKTFTRWAVGADLGFHLTTKAGISRLYGEALLASNLDRALYIADPTLNNRNKRELSWYVAFVQDITQWGFVGVRYDVYDPNLDEQDSRRGSTVPRDASIKTLSPIVGLRWPGVARLTFEYDFVQDHLARDTRGVPTDLANNQWTLRAQGQF